MNTTITVLNRLKSTFQLPSDYAISKLLGITRTAVSDYRSNKRNMSDEVAFKAAKLLNISAVDLVTKLHKERANTTDEIQVWDSIVALVEFQKSFDNQEVKDALRKASKTSPTLKKLADNVEQYILC